MKAFEKGRRTLNWMGIHFVDDEPISGHLRLAQNASAAIFAMVFIVIVSLHIKTFVNLRTINPEEFFFVLLQFVMTAHGFSAFITVYSRCSRISVVFQCLTKIYDECEQNERKHYLIQSIAIWNLFCWRSRWTSDSYQCQIRAYLSVFPKSNESMDFCGHHIAVSNNNFAVPHLARWIWCCLSIPSFSTQVRRRNTFWLAQGLLRNSIKFHFIRIVYHGIKPHQSDIAAKFVSPFWISRFFGLSAPKSYYFSYFCVKIISHFVQCSKAL